MKVSKETYDQVLKTRKSAIEFADINDLVLTGESAAEIKQSLAEQLEVDEQLESEYIKQQAKDIEEVFGAGVTVSGEWMDTEQLKESLSVKIHSINNLSGDVIFKTRRAELTVKINGETYTEKANGGLVFISTGKPFGEFPAIDYVIS